MRQLLARLTLALFFTFVFLARIGADELDNKYLQILNAVDQAEALEKAGKSEAARAKFLAIQQALLEIRKADPTWKPNMVAYRLKEVDAKLAAHSGNAPAADENAATTAPAKAAPATPLSPPRKPSEPSTSPAASTISMKLLSPGAEPRRALRYQPKAGDNQKALVTTKTGVEMSMAGNALPKMAMPIMKLPVETTVDAVSSDGDISFTTSMGEIKLVSTGDEMPGVADAMSAVLAGLNGMKAPGIKNSRGAVKSADLKLAADASPQLRQSMEQVKDALAGLALVFPEEPVGVGAKWEARQTINSQGIAIQQTSNYELTAVDGDRVEVRIKILQSAANQKISNPAMAGMKMNLEKMESTGEGNAVFDLKRLMSVSGEVNSIGNMKMSMDLGGQKQAVEMKTSSETKVESQSP